MPSINRKQIRPKTEYKHENQSAEYYSSTAWRDLRQTYYNKQPLCECCLSRDRVRSADHIHHRRRFLSGRDEAERWSLLLTESNLISLCTVCHYAIHDKMDKYKMDYCDELTDKEYMTAHNIEKL